MKHSTFAWYIPSPKLSAQREWLMQQEIDMYRTTLELLTKALSEGPAPSNVAGPVGTDKAEDIAGKISEGYEALGGQAQLATLTPKEILKKMRNLLNQPSLPPLDTKKILALLVSYNDVVTRSRVSGNPNGPYGKRKLA